MKRTVELNIDMEKIEHGEQKQLDLAVGYLSMWAGDIYPIVKIYNDRENDLVAYYYTTDLDSKVESKPGYVIGAVWREESKKYSFHS